MRHELIFVGNPGPLTGAGNNTYLLPGLEPTLIDAGTGQDTACTPYRQSKVKLGRTETKNPDSFRQAIVRHFASCVTSNP